MDDRFDCKPTVHYEVGNLLNAPVNYICQQVNCQGAMGAGIARQIRERWPVVYSEYMNCYFNYADCDDEEALLGTCQQVQVSNNQYVINMFAQHYYGNDGRRYTSYDAFWSCLGYIKKQVPKGSKIGFPYGIGCGLGGANWQVISTMICEALGNDYEVYIYQL